MWTQLRQLGSWCVRVGEKVWMWLRALVHRRPRSRRWVFRQPGPLCRRAFSQPKPKWVKHEVIRLKALMPETGCRTIAHHFNRRWAGRRQMTVGKSYVAGTLRKHQYLVLEARRKLKHRVPWPMPRNRVWGCDLLVKTDADGRARLAQPSSITPAAPVCDCTGCRKNPLGRCCRNSFKQ